MTFDYSRIYIYISNMINDNKAINKSVDNKRLLYRELMDYAIIYWFLTIVSVILSCSIISKLLNTKYLKVILGKF